MTAVVFEDVEGRRGYVTEGLEVDYQGPWADVVRMCVDRIGVDDYPGVEHGVAGDVYGTLILELTEVAPIVRAGRVDDPAAGGPAADEDASAAVTAEQPWSPAGPG